MRRVTLFLICCMLLTSVTAFAIGEKPTPTPTPAAQSQTNIFPTTSDGVRNILGILSYTNAYFTLGVAEPIVILEDQTGFITRNRNYVLPIESQTLGQFTTSIFESPVSYTLSLPLEPQAPLNDVDNDGQTDTGVMVFAVAYWTNTWGDPFLEERDLQGGGWSTGYASTLVSANSDSLREYIGGKILIYAPDAAQSFPSSFGADGKLFTSDDPVAPIEAGYTVVDMSQQPFVLDRSETVTVDLLEGEASAADNFSELNYSEAFDAMIEKFRTDYAFTEYKNLDWDALSAEFRPRVEQAQQARDAEAFCTALQEFVWSIPDGHVSISSTPTFQNRFTLAIEGGIGMAVRTLDDGSVIVSYILPDGPADQAGIEVGAMISAFDGVGVAEHINAAQPFSAPFSTRAFELLQKERYALRFPLNSTVEVEYTNPNDSMTQIADVPVIAERDSFNFSSFNRERNPVALPVETQVLDSGYLLIRITSFADNERLTVDLFERALARAQSLGVLGIILDMRNNGGGSGYLAKELAAYFFDETLIVGQRARYDETLNEFYIDPEQEDRFVLAPVAQRYYELVAVMVGPNCLSACEFFSYYMTLQDRATIVGYYPSGGLGGSVEIFFMPDGLQMQMTTGRALDANGEIHLEGSGAVPTVKVPVNAENVLSMGDPVLEAAIDYLSGQ